MFLQFNPDCSAGLVVFATLLLCKIDLEMGNMLPIKLVLNDMDEEEDSPDTQRKSRLSRNEQFAMIRSLNLKNKTDTMQQAPNTNTIVEEAVL